MLEDARPHRGDAVQPRGAMAGGRRAAASRRRARARSAPAGGACQAPSAIVQPAMWNSGNMHTVPPPPGRRGRAGIRAQPVRAVRQHDALRPAGAPAREEDDVRVALVELADRGRRSRRPRRLELGRRTGSPTRSASSRAGSRCDAPASSSRGRAYSATGRTSSTDARAFNGANTAPSFAERAEHRDRLERGVAPPQHPVAAPDRRCRAQAVGDPVRRARRSRRT